MPDADLRLSDFEYDLPPERIAQQPARPRDAARLLVLDRQTGATEHRRFHDLPDLLLPRDLLVVNDTRVIPAAFTARRATGARIEGCFLRVVHGELGGVGEQVKGSGAEQQGLLTPAFLTPAIQGPLWEVLLAGRGRIRAGETLALVDAGGEERACIELVSRGEGGTWHVRPPAGVEPVALLAQVGRPPLPPYIHREGVADARAGADRDDYQTVFARVDGAVAAPTAGLHFTPRVLETLASRGIERVAVTLHVGLGTFRPVRCERLADHAMHEEYLEVSPAAAAHINQARSEGRRVVAVGTTTVRALESAAGEGGVQPGGRWTRLFIRPPYRFRVVDAMVTNFHLPRTTLLVMVSAFAGRDRILAAYAEAVREGYRFYSYGDAMLIR